MAGQAHAGHILLPIDPMVRFGGDLLEREKLQRVYKMAHHRTDMSAIKGRVMRLDNLPFSDSKGNLFHWSPTQAAVMATRKGLADGFDMLHVHTPGKEKEAGERALVDVYFSVRAIKDFLLIEPEAFRDTERGALLHNERDVDVELEGGNHMPTKWAFTEGGLLAPRV